MDEEFTLGVKHGTKIVKVTLRPSNTLKDLRDKLFAQTGIVRYFAPDSQVYLLNYKRLCSGANCVAMIRQWGL